jgi:hypothetical protein
VRVHESAQTKEQVADADGHVRVALGDAPFDGTLSLDVWADGYVQQRHWFFQVDPRRPPIPETVRIELLPGEETLGGRVVNEDGDPVAGAKVETWGYLGELKEPHELAHMVTATTNERGEWRARSFRKMTFAYLYISHPDYVCDDDSHPRPHVNPNLAGNPPGNRPLEALRDLSDVQVLARGIELSGIVVDAKGKRVPGADVAWVDYGNSLMFGLVRPVQTDADGRFQFPHLRPGKILVQARAKGCAPDVQTIDLQPGTEPIVIDLGPPSSIAGIILDSRGLPIPGVDVFVTWGRYRLMGGPWKTGLDGRFRLDEAPSEVVDLRTSRIGYAGIMSDAARPGDEVKLTMKRNLTISGSIRDAITGQRIREANVELGLPGSAPGQIVWRTNASVTAQDGEVNATLDAEAPREYRVRIGAKGYQTHESRMFRSDEGHVQYDVKLTKAD